MADQKNCSTGNVQCKGPSGIRCKKSCSTKLKNPTNIKRLNRLVDVINKARDTKTGKLAEDNFENVVVNTAGTLGGFVGGASGPVGAIVGDLLASTAVKHSILVKDSYDDLANTEEFESKTRWEKAKAVLERARANDQKAKAAGEATGFLVGNSVAETTKFIPGIGGLPMKGAAAAMIVMPILQQQINQKLGVS